MSPWPAGFSELGPLPCTQCPHQVTDAKWVTRQSGCPAQPQRPEACKSGEGAGHPASQTLRWDLSFSPTQLSLGVGRCVPRRSCHLHNQALLPGRPSSPHPCLLLSYLPRRTHCNHPSSSLITQASSSRHRCCPPAAHSRWQSLSRQAGRQLTVSADHCSLDRVAWTVPRGQELGSQWRPI